MKRAKIVVTRRIPEEAARMLEEQAHVVMWHEADAGMPRDLLLEEVRDADGLYVTLTDRVDRELLDAAPRLKVVSTMAVGYDNIDVAAATERGIPVGHTPGVLTETTADLTFALLLATARRIVEAAEYVKEGKWKSWSPMLLTGRDVYGATLGIIGMGRIGEAVARRAAGFHMKILYHNRSRRPAAEQALGAEYRPLDELLAESDYVVLLVPSTAETRHMIGERELRLMKPTAVFINTSRGTNVDEAALYRALKERWIWAAGLDVFEREPIGADHPLLALPNVVALPHIGSASIATRIGMAVLAAENVLAGVAGERLKHVANPEVYARQRRSPL